MYTSENLLLQTKACIDENYAFWLFEAPQRYDNTVTAFLGSFTVGIIHVLCRDS